MGCLYQLPISSGSYEEEKAERLKKPEALGDSKDTVSSNPIGWMPETTETVTAHRRPAQTQVKRGLSTETGKKTPLTEKFSVLDTCWQTKISFLQWRFTG